MVQISLIHPQTEATLQTWHFPNQSVISIGRAADNDIILDSYLEVSRHHLELRHVGNSGSLPQWQLTNRGTNGTFLNGVLASQGLVMDQSRIQLAKDGPLLKFELQTPLVGSTPPSKTPIAQSNPPACTHTGNPPTNLFCIHCGQPLVEQQQFIRQYQVLRTLGQGGMGTTYLAWDKTHPKAKPPKLVVLKEMNADMAQIAKARELFEREARILKSLQHSGIPRYYDFFVEREKKYLAMEIIHGQDLEKQIYQKGPVTPKEAIAWMIQVCEILGYLHGLNPPLIHRDVKPANLMVRHLDNRIVLLDFGAVKEIGTPIGTRIGAEGYSAPEQDRGQPCPQSDLYAIGPTLIFLLTGQAPLMFYRRVGTTYRFDVSRVPTITPQLAKVIERACEPQIQQRYQRAEDLVKDLMACQ